MNLKNYDNLNKWIIIIIIWNVNKFEYWFKKNGMVKLAISKQKIETTNKRKNKTN